MELTIKQVMDLAAAIGLTVSAEHIEDLETEITIVGQVSLTDEEDGTVSHYKNGCFGNLRV